MSHSRSENNNRLGKPRGGFRFLPNLRRVYLISFAQSFAAAAQ
jgi:hypothetical protein